MSKNAGVASSRYDKLLTDYNELDLKTLPKPKISIDFPTQ